MARFERYYAWFLLFVTVLPAAMRLTMPARVALLTSQRMVNAKTRSRYFKIGVASVLASLAAAAAYFLISE